MNKKVLLFIFLMGLSIRLIPIITDSVPHGGRDAAFFYNLGMAFYENNFFPLDMHPVNDPFVPREKFAYSPGVPEILAIAYFLGVSEHLLILGFIPIVISSLGILFIYPLAKELTGDEKISLLASAFFALSLRDLFGVWWGHWAMSTSAIINIPILYFFVKYLKTENMKFVYLLSFLIGIESLIYIRALLTTIPFIFAFFLVYRLKKGSNFGFKVSFSNLDENTLKKIFAVLLIVAFAVVVFSGLFIVRLIGPGTYGTEGGHVSGITYGHLLAPHPLYSAYPTWYVNPIPAYNILFFFAVLGFLVAMKRNLIPSFFIASFLSTHLELYGLGGSARHYIFNTPAIVILAAYFVYNLPKKLSKHALIIAIILGGTLAIAGGLLQKPNVTKEELNSAFWIRENTESDATILYVGIFDNVQNPSAWVETVARRAYTYDRNDDYQYIWTKSTEESETLVYDKERVRIYKVS